MNAHLRSTHGHGSETVHHSCGRRHGVGTGRRTRTRPDTPLSAAGKNRFARTCWKLGITRVVPRPVFLCSCYTGFPTMLTHTTGSRLNWLRPGIARLPCTCEATDPHGSWIRRSPHMAEQAAIGQDVLDLADALKLQRLRCVVSIGAAARRASLPHCIRIGCARQCSSAVIPSRIPSRRTAGGACRRSQCLVSVVLQHRTRSRRFDAESQSIV